MTKCVRGSHTGQQIFEFLRHQMKISWAICCISGILDPNLTALTDCKLSQAKTILDFEAASVAIRHLRIPRISLRVLLSLVSSREKRERYSWCDGRMQLPCLCMKPPPEAVADASWNRTEVSSADRYPGYLKTSSTAFPRMSDEILSFLNCTDRQNMSCAWAFADQCTWPDQKALKICLREHLDMPMILTFIAVDNTATMSLVMTLAAL